MRQPEALSDPTGDLSDSRIAKENPSVRNLNHGTTNLPRAENQNIRRFHAY